MKIIKILIAFLMFFACLSQNVSANSLEIIESGYDYGRGGYKFKFNDNNYVSTIEKVSVNDIDYIKTTGYYLGFKNEYLLNGDILYINKLSSNDVVKIQNQGNDFTFKIINSDRNNLIFEIPNNTTDVTSENNENSGNDVTVKNELKLISSRYSSLFKSGVLQFNNSVYVNNISEVYVNNVKYESIDSKYFDDNIGQYNKSENELYINKLNTNDIIKIISKDYEDKNYKISSIDLTGSTLSLEISDPYVEENVENPNTNNSEVNVISTYFDFMKNGYVLEFNNEDYVKNITDVLVDSVSYKKASNTSLSYLNKEYLIVEGPKLYINKLEINNVITIVSSMNENLSYRILDLNRYKNILTLEKTVENQTSDNDVVDVEEEILVEDKKFRHSITLKNQSLIKNITSIKVNDKYYSKTLNSAGVFDPSTNYYLGDSEIQIGTLKSNDIVKIAVDGKVVFHIKIKEKNTGKDTYVIEHLPIEDSSEDMLPLNVRIRGYFENAMLNQKGYDAISGASSSSSVNQNSDVVIEVSEDKDLKEESWKNLSTLDHIKVDATKSKVIIDEKSGMKGVYSISSGKLTLSGTPKNVGIYPVKVEIVDELGRKAVSNELFFEVYSQSEMLINHLKLENAKKMEDGKYIWDMKPWYISKFAEDETVIVPKDIKAWYGSHTSGTYGVLGNSDSKIIQTLIIDEDTDLTLVNMKVLSSVNIVVKNNARLNIRDSSIYGTITVLNGGKLQVNYDPSTNKFLTGSSINGQIVLNDGAILENCLIYSNTNNLTDGKVAKKNVSAVVKVNGNITVDGQIFIKGDESPTGDDPNTNRPYSGQVGMEVENGSINIKDNSVLGVFGGGLYATTTLGGDAIILKNSEIKGNGKLIASGGNGTYLEGGKSISGVGKVNTKYVYLSGGNSNTRLGKLKDDSIIIGDKSKTKFIEGSINSLSYNVSEDNNKWLSILLPPDLNKFVIENESFELTSYNKNDIVTSPSKKIVNTTNNDVVTSATKNNKPTNDIVSSPTKNKQSNDIVSSPTKYTKQGNDIVSSSTKSVSKTAYKNDVVTSSTVKKEETLKKQSVDSTNNKEDLKISTNESDKNKDNTQKDLSDTKQTLTRKSIFENSYLIPLLITILISVILIILIFKRNKQEDQ